MSIGRQFEAGIAELLLESSRLRSKDQIFMLFFLLLLTFDKFGERPSLECDQETRCF